MFLLMGDKIFATFKNSPMGVGAGIFATAYGCRKLGLGWIPTIGLSVVGGLIGSHIEFKIKHPDFQKELEEGTNIE